MKRRSTGLLAVLIVLAPAFLGSCGDKPAPPETVPPELGELTRNAENWAARAETILLRPWASRLAFRTRIYGRVQALRTFVQEGAAAVNGAAGPHDRLIARGRVLVNEAAAFDTALALLERVTRSLDSITGYDRVIELHMTPLETRGEAPFRIRITDLQGQIKLGFTHLDEALTGILGGAPDAKTHENIATHNLSAALETATKLCEEVKKTSALAGAATDRQKLLKARIEWADGIASKVGKDIPSEAAQALSDARVLSDQKLPAETTAILERLRNAQPDGAERAEELATRADAAIERLTRSFLELGRKSGVGDPK